MGTTLRSKRLWGVISIMLALMFALSTLGGTALAGGNGKGKTTVKNPKPHVTIHEVHKGREHGGPKGGGGGEDPVDHTSHYVLQPGKWAGNAPAVSYVFDDRFAPAGAVDEIRASADVWNPASGLDFSYGGTEEVNTNAELDADTDDVTHNTVSFRLLIGSWNQALAVTITWFDDVDNDGVWDDGESIEGFDMLFNTKYTWAIDPDGEGSEKADVRGKYFDIRNVGSHEFGHVVGLKHPDFDDETMYFASGTKETKKRSLEPGDIAGAQALYGPEPPA